MDDKQRIKRLVIETSEQLIVFYDPKRHHGFKACYDKDQLVSKLVLAVFATGEDIREQAVLLHKKATQMVAELAQALGQSADLFKIRDHQHITYELFAAEKGDKKTTTHGLRFVPHRYLWYLSQPRPIFSKIHLVDT